MKILFDENLSYRVVRDLKLKWPECRSVEELGLKRKPDSEIWGSPPKIMYLRLMNATRIEVILAFQRHAAMIEEFIKSESIAVLFLN